MFMMWRHCGLHVKQLRVASLTTCTCGSMSILRRQGTCHIKAITDACKDKLQSKQ